MTGTARLSRRRSPVFDYVARFWARVRKDPGDTTACWVWTGPPVEFGYGRASYGYRRVDLAHRVAWRLAYGEIPDGSCVLHRCDNPPCVRPDHLFLGDRGDNARDMAAKGRQHVQRHPERRPICPPERIARGERTRHTKLTAEQVLQIRERHAAGAPIAALVRAFGVGFTAITYIVDGRTWKHVGGPIQPRRFRKVSA